MAQSYYARCIGILAVCMLSSFAAAGDLNLMCRSEGQDRFWIETKFDQKFNQTLYCISGGDFVVDLTACAPTGGWGLSQGTGAAKLVYVTKDKVIADEHFYGRVRADVDAVRMEFSAYFGRDIPSGSADLIWRVRIDRKTGHAQVEDFLEKRNNPYICQVVE
jgi:hypothetical protein